MTPFTKLRLDDDLDPLELEDEEDLEDDEEGDDPEDEDDLDDEEDWLADEDDEPPYTGDVDED